MNLRNILTIFAVALYAISANAQVIIGSGNAPHSFSVLELINNDIQGFRLPQMYECERDTMEESPEFQAVKSDKAVGLMIFNLSNGCVEIWRGSYWISLCYGEECLPFTALTHNPTSLTINNICFGAATPSLTVTPVRGTTPFNTQWFSNTTNSTGGTAIANATTATFTPNSSVAGTRFYYAMVSNCEGNNTMPSNIFTVTVHPAFHTPPFQGTRAAICAGTQPANINLGASTGGSGTFTYQWMQSTNNGLTWTPVGGNVQNLAGSTIGALNQTTFFYRRATNDCGTTSSFIITQPVQAAISLGNPTVNIITAGANAGRVSVNLGNVSGASFQWYTRPANSSTWVRVQNAGLGINIANATQQNLTNMVLAPGAPGGARYFRRVTTNGPCSHVSGEARVNLPALTPPTVTNMFNLCPRFYVRTNIALPTGGGGTGWGHQWEIASAAAGPWADIPGATGSQLQHCVVPMSHVFVRRRSWRTGSGATPGIVRTATIGIRADTTFGNNCAPGIMCLPLGGVYLQRCMPCP